MRLIDADVLIDEANSDGAYGYVDAKQISEAPTIDAVEVMRCKDCKYSYYISERWRCSHGICCGRTVPPGFYCAEGKRKENDE